MDQQSTRTDITVNVDGFWMLQALLDIRHVAPELRCRPFVSTDSIDWLNEHPGHGGHARAGHRRRRRGARAGRRSNAGARRARPRSRRPAVAGQTALRRRRTTRTSRPGSRDIPDNEFRVVLARRGQHWVSAVRVGNDITVDDVAIADSASIAALVFDALESIHHAEPAAINAVNVPLEEMLEATKAWQESGFNVFSGGDLRRMGISAATVAALGQALSDPAAEVAVYARQYRDDAKGAQRLGAVAEGWFGRPHRDVPAGANRGFGRGLAGDLPGHSAAGAGGREDRAGHAALRRVENAQQGLTYPAKYKVHAMLLHISMRPRCECGKLL